MYSCFFQHGSLCTHELCNVEQADPVQKPVQMRERRHPGELKRKEPMTLEDANNSMSALNDLIREKQANVESAGVEFHLAIFRLIVDAWKSEICTTWIPLDPQIHECCVDSASIRRNTYYAQATCIEDDAADSTKKKTLCRIDNIPAKLYATRSGELHVCVADLCERQKAYCDTMEQLDGQVALHQTLKSSFTEVYVCRITGKPHYCGTYCEYLKSVLEKNDKTPVKNEDHTFVCPLTGWSAGMQEIRGKIHLESNERHDFKQKYYDFVNNPLSKKQKKRHESIGDLDGIIHNSLQSTSFVLSSSSTDAKDVSANRVPKKKKGSTRARMISRAKTMEYMDKRKIQMNQSYRQYYLRLAAEKVGSFLSPERVREYVRRQEKNQPKLLKMFHNYATKCMQHDKVMNACHLGEIAREENKYIYIPPDISRIPKETMKEIVLQYARLCVCMWYLIRTKTKEGRESPEKFYFPDFVDNILVLMKNGIQVDGDQTGLLYTILRGDDFLNFLPNSEHEERKKGDRARKIIRKGNTKMKKEIKSAIIHAITVERVSPNELTPYHVNIEELDESKFVDIDSCFGRKDKGEKNRKKQKKEATMPDQAKPLESASAQSTVT